MLRQHVIVMRGRFAAQEFPVLDLDIMVEVCVEIMRRDFVVQISTTVSLDGS